MNFSKHLAMFIYVYADIAMKSWYVLLAVYPGYVQQERYLETWEG
jgi:hypothetical protein